MGLTVLLNVHNSQCSINSICLTWHSLGLNCGPCVYIHTCMVVRMYIHVCVCMCMLAQLLTLIPTYLYSEAGYNDLYEYFLRGKESLRIDQKVQSVTGLNREQVSIITVCIQC